MGLLDQAQQGLGQLIGQFGGKGNSNSFIGATAKLITSSDIGGLQGLIRKFQQSGYGDAVQSWITGSEKKPISGEDVQKVLGQDKVRQVADQAGVSEQEASHGLAAVIPQLVDRMTPSGQMPDEQSANSSLSQLAGKFLGP